MSNTKFGSAFKALWEIPNVIIHYVCKGTLDTFVSSSTTDTIMTIILMHNTCEVGSGKVHL